jgi:hypothetical protein
VYAGVRRKGTEAIRRSKEAPREAEMKGELAVMGGPKLTTAQSAPLLNVVEYQRAKGEELVFTHSGDRILASRTESGKDVALSETPIAEVSQPIFVVWQERDCVVPIESAVASGPTIRDFVLTQEALDYANRMRKPRLVRWFLGILDDWRSDLRTALLAMAFTIITTVILYWLGLLR